MSFVNRDNFTSFPIWMPFFFLPNCSVWDFQQAMLNNSGESEHCCLIPDGRGRAFRLSPFTISCGFFIKIIFHVEVSF